MWASGRSPRFDRCPRHAPDQEADHQKQANDEGHGRAEGQRCCGTRLRHRAHRGGSTGRRGNRASTATDSLAISTSRMTSSWPSDESRTRCRPASSALRLSRPVSGSVRPTGSSSRKTPAPGGSDVISSVGRGGATTGGGALVRAGATVGGVGVGLRAPATPPPRRGREWARAARAAGWARASESPRESESPGAVAAGPRRAHGSGPRAPPAPRRARRRSGPKPAAPPPHPRSPRGEGTPRPGEGRESTVARSSCRTSAPALQAGGAPRPHASAARRPWGPVPSGARRDRRCRARATAGPTPSEASVLPAPEARRRSRGHASTGPRSCSLSHQDHETLADPSETGKASTLRAERQGGILRAETAARWAATRLASRGPARPLC